jgi:putative transposase
MARFPRVVATGAAHHITQRGNARRDVFFTDSDRRIYLDLLGDACRLHRLDLHGYCLMPNHVHLIAVPERPDSLPLAMKAVHGRYASYLNARQIATGHVWQGRYYSCPLDQYHLWEALRYTELNPVRAGMIERAEDYHWSSAASHCRPHDGDTLIQYDLWWTRFTAASWREFLQARPSEELVKELRESTHAGRPLGVPQFVQAWERDLHRTLAPRKGGRPLKVRTVENKNGETSRLSPHYEAPAEGRTG